MVANRWQKVIHEGFVRREKENIVEGVEFYRGRYFKGVTRYVSTKACGQQLFI